MERLTIYGLFCDLAVCQEVPCKYPDTGCSQRQVWERLKNIEDILCDNFDTYDLSRLKELVEADREGRCLVLPVNPGDTVYKFKSKFDACEGRFRYVDIMPGTVSFVMVSKSGDIKFRVNYKNSGWNMYSSSEIGKTVFLTREAAEKALEDNAYADKHD